MPSIRPPPWQAVERAKCRADLVRGGDRVEVQGTSTINGDISTKSIVVLEGGKPVGTVKWDLLGAHNAENALAAIGAARHAGVPVAQSIAALAEFKGVKRRMELRGEAGGVAVYDDFAHHPTAIATTLDGLRRKVGARRIVAVLEPRSATMKMGVHRDTLAPSLASAMPAYAPLMAATLSMRRSWSTIAP